MMQKLGDGMKKALVLVLSLFAAAGATAVEEINKQISRTTSRCDVWEVCCASDSGLTQALVRADNNLAHGPWSARYLAFNKQCCTDLCRLGTYHTS